ncbi:MAG: DUF2723 domain-containing protein, partial [Candidatus Kryptoniota bacterium]
VLWTLGIAHPTGYPLFMLLGYAFVHLPFFSEVAIRANLFAVVCASIASGVFYFVFLRAQFLFAPADKAPDSHARKSEKQKKKKPARENSVETNSDNYFAVRVTSAVASLSLIFSKTFWTQSTVVESYPLQLLLFAVILAAWLKFYSAPTKMRAFFAGSALGLGFTNHMTTMLTIPALIFVTILGYRQKRLELRILYFIIIGGALAGSLYLYLPIRASQHPLLDWGNPDNIQRFIRHVTAKQFRSWMFSSVDVFQHQLGIFYSSLYPEFRFTILIVLLGIITSLISYNKYFWWTTILLLSDLLYAANYSIHNIQSYFLLAYISLALFAAVGFRFLFEWTSQRVERLWKFSWGKIVVASLLLLFPAVSALSNYNEVDASNDRAVEMYTRDILTCLPQNSLVLSYQWDTFVAASLYYQNIMRLRSDIIVIDKELLRRSWYASQVHNRYAFIFPTNDPAYNEYQDNLRLFENELPYDPAVIEHSYSAFIREIIFGAMKNGRDVFVGPELEDQYLYGFNKVPYGLLFELKTDTSYVPFAATGLNGFRAAKAVDNDYSHQIANFYSRMFQARAAYEYLHKNLTLTLFWLNKALEVDPSSQPVQTAKLQVLQQLSRLKPAQAELPSGRTN